MDHPLPNDGVFSSNWLHNWLLGSQLFIWIQYFLLNYTLAEQHVITHSIVKYFNILILCC